MSYMYKLVHKCSCACFPLVKALTSCWTGSHILDIVSRARPSHSRGARVWRARLILDIIESVVWLSGYWQMYFHESKANENAVYDQVQYQPNSTFMSAIICVLPTSPAYNHAYKTP